MNPPPPPPMGLPLRRRQNTISGPPPPSRPPRHTAHDREPRVRHSSTAAPFRDTPGRFETGGGGGGEEMIRDFPRSVPTGTAATRGRSIEAPRRRTSAGGRARALRGNAAAGAGVSGARETRGPAAMRPRARARRCQKEGVQDRRIGLAQAVLPGEGLCCSVGRGVGCPPPPPSACRACVGLLVTASGGGSAPPQPKRPLDCPNCPTPTAFITDRNCAEPICRPPPTAVDRP